MPLLIAPMVPSIATRYAKNLRIAARALRAPKRSSTSGPRAVVGGGLVILDLHSWGRVGLKITLVLSTRHPEGQILQPLLASDGGRRLLFPSAEQPQRRQCRPGSGTH